MRWQPIPPIDLEGLQALLSRVCKPFEQFDNQDTRAKGGTGLGLPIVEGLINLHRGSLTIASVVGKGSSVPVRLLALPTIALTGNGRCSP